MRISRGRSDDLTATMGRVSASLFLLGSAMTVSGVLLPHSSKADIDGFWAMAAGTALLGVLLLAFGERIPTRGYEGLMLLGSLTVTLSLFFNGERHGAPSAGNQVLYVWIALFSGYFFSRRAIVLQLAAIASLFGAVLLVIHPGPSA